MEYAFRGEVLLLNNRGYLDDTETDYVLFFYTKERNPVLHFSPTAWEDFTVNDMHDFSREDIKFFV